MTTHLAGLEFEHPLMNGAGTCKTLEQVDNLAKSCVAAVVVGSITAAPRAGNPGQTYWECADYSINSLGLPNLGIKYYSETLPKMATVVHNAGKVLIVSVAGSEADEYVELTTQALRCGADLVELNLGCPNVWDGGRQKMIPCFDVDYTRSLCRRVAEGLRGSVENGKPAGSFGIKISPFSDPFALELLAEMIAETADECQEFKFVTATNTFPNALIVDQDGKPRIDMGLGGLGGRAMKPIVLGHIKQLRRLLPENIDLIGIGGITCGGDMAEYLAVGATCVQATTAYAGARDPGIFADILSEYANFIRVDDDDVTSYTPA